ncbi:MAG: signal peptide peptidase SppA [Calditrichia bacterium]
MKGWMKIALLIAVVFICVASFYYLMFSSIFKGAPPIGRDSYLELNIFGEISERGTADPFTRLFAGEVPSLDGLLHCIRKAKIDPKIKGIILRPLASEMGWAKAEELREVLLDFKSSGKPIYVYIEAIGNKEYYLTVVGDMIFGSPTGMLFVNGLLGGSYFFKGSLDKLGIEADFVARGKYKNAPDIFTRKNMSDSHREVINSILDDYYQRYVEAIAQGRNLEIEQVRKIIDRGVYTLAEAEQSQLIDTLLYYNEFKDYLKEKDGKKPRLVSYERYKKVPYSKLGVHAEKTFALIYAVGNIVSGIGEDAFGDGIITSESLANLIRKVAKDKKVEAIIMRVDSPGGSGLASDVIWKEVAKAQQEKPFIVSMSDVAASGGYYISMSADSIVGQPSSIVGSIGVFSGKFSFRGLYEKLGISKEEIPRGKNADLFSEIKTFNTEQRGLIGKIGDDFYQRFVSKVAESRNMTYEEVDKIAQGRVWTGEQALEVGLIDKLGGLKEAFEIGKKMCGIPLDEHVRVKIYPEKRSILERLLNARLETHTSLTEEFVPKSVQQYFRAFLMYSPGEPLAVLPFYPEIK